MKRQIIITLALATALTVSACSQKTTPPFGDSVRMAVKSQTLNPEAGSTDPVTGLSGEYSASTMEGYKKAGVSDQSSPGILESMLGAMGGGK